MPKAEPDHTFQRIAQFGQAAGIVAGTQVRRSRDWYRTLAQSMTKVSRAGLLKANPSVAEVGAEMIGRMVSFFYSAKTADKLPYWDRFPLVFPIEIYSNGFLGLNLHYLPPFLRAKLMDALYTTSKAYRDKKKYTSENTVLQLSYQVLAGAARFRYFKPCIKRYLSAYVQSSIMVVPVEHWDSALMLPTQKFTKASATTVWRDSEEALA